jgi:hypothetical protein
MKNNFHTWCSKDISQILLAVGGPKDGYPSIDELTKMLSLGQSSPSVPQILYMPITFIMSSTVNGMPSITSNIHYALYQILSKMPIHQAREAVIVLFERWMHFFFHKQNIDSATEQQPKSILDFLELVCDLSVNINALYDILDMDATQNIALYIICPSNIPKAHQTEKGLENLISSFINRYSLRRSTVKILVAGSIWDFETAPGPFMTDCVEFRKLTIGYDAERQCKRYA